MHVAALADRHVGKAAVTEEAVLAAELVHDTLLGDLVFALQSFGDERKTTESGPLILHRE